MPDPEVDRQMRQDWDRRAREDACYYVAFGRRRQSAEEFFATAADVLHAIRVELPRFPSGTDPAALSALEIGCGPGRLLVPLSRLFGSVVGVDVSQEMIDLARANLAGIPNARAELASGSDLAQFPADAFDLCYSYAVFQHIPSREVVFNYLREARRVLKIGGILKCQFNGLPEDARVAADTWSGVRFRHTQLRAFCRDHDLQLLLLDGLDTQNLWMSARKRPAGSTASLRPVPGARLIRISNTYTGDLVVPAAGRFSSASLWVQGLAADADCNNLQVEIAGRLAAPCYVGGRGPQGPNQVNVFLPPETPTGPVPVRLWMLGQPISGFARLRVIPAPPPAPRILSVTDGINLLSNLRTDTRSLKVQVEEVGRHPVFHASLGGRPLEDLDLSCVDPLSDRYAINLKVPPEIPPGPHRLILSLGGRPFAPVQVEVVA